MAAFETIDKVLTFIDPQTDKEVKLVTGEPYPCYLVGTLIPLGYSDLIVEIQVIW